MESDVHYEETEEVQSIEEQKIYSKDLLVQRFVDLMRTKHADIQFTFERDDDIVKIPAHKDVLASLSPVFNAMFNGDLREDGDVKIVDAKPAIFEVFLQFFYGSQVNLTLDNISDVLDLIDKYDVADVATVCVDFLKNHLKIDDILWGLHLAIKFNLLDLKEYCKSKIQENHEKIFSMFTFDEYDNIMLCTADKNKRLLEIDVDNIMPHVFVVSRDIISKITVRINQLQKKRNFFSISLSNGEMNTTQKLTNNETIIFSVDVGMLLTDIFCSKIYTYNYSQREYEISTSIFELMIEEKPDFFGWDAKTLYTTQIVIGDEEIHHKHLSPIVIKPNVFYAITLKSDIQSHGTFHTCNITIPNESISIAPGVNISFPYRNPKRTHSLISRMYFAHLIDS